MNIVITAGGTREKIDEVRYITNMSSGKLGMEIFNSLKNHKIFYIYTKGSVYPTKSLYTPNLILIEATDTESVLNAVKKVISENKIDVFIHAMAISDYTVDKVFSIEDISEALKRTSTMDNYILHTEDSIINALKNIKGIDTNSKIGSNNEEMFISITKTPKIVDSIKKMDKDIFLISFKLLENVSEEHLIDIAHKQLERTDSNIVIANDLKNIREGNHIAHFVVKDKEYKTVKGKDNIGEEIAKRIKGIE